MTRDTRHFEQSSLREEYVEYIFLAGLCHAAWQKNRPLEILRSQTDDRGYDLILETEDVQRHVQLKSSYIGASTSSQKVSTLLSNKPSGCVIWIRFDSETLEQREFLWFGGSPGSRLPDLGNRIAKHTKANAHGEKSERANHRVLRKSDFNLFDSHEEVFAELFGHFSMSSSSAKLNTEFLTANQTQ